MQKQIKRLNAHIRICKIIILILLAVILFQAMPQGNDIEILQSEIDLCEELRIEAHKLHQLEEYKSELKEID